MGKQRSKILRNKAEQLYDICPEKFSDDFEKNKLALKELKLFNSAVDRNICAGILVKLAKPKEL